jgi:hypothetical protein
MIDLWGVTFVADSMRRLSVGLHEFHFNRYCILVARSIAWFFSQIDSVLAAFYK